MQLFVNIPIKCYRSQSGYTRNKNFSFLVSRTLLSIMALRYFGRYFFYCSRIFLSNRSDSISHHKTFIYILKAHIFCCQFESTEWLSIFPRFVSFNIQSILLVTILTSVGKDVKSVKDFIEYNICIIISWITP